MRAGYVKLLLLLAAGSAGVLARTAIPSTGSAGVLASNADDSRVHLVHADQLSYDQWRNNGAQVLVGQVQFFHDGATLFCDSANFFERDNRFEAWGNVKMVQGDTLSLTCDHGYYNGEEHTLRAIDDVVLIHRTTTLYTNWLTYDRLWAYAYFEDGGRLVDKGTTLVSDWGEYHTDTKKASFYFDVRMTDKKFVLTTDSLHYDTQTKVANIIGPSDIVSGKSHIKSQLGYYNTDTEEAELLLRSEVTNGGKRLTGDSLWHSSKTGRSEAFRDVVFIDSINRNRLLCNYGIYEDSTGYALCTDSAMAVDYSQPDTLFVHADTFKVFSFNLNTDSVYRELHAFNRVRAFRTQMQAVCDSLVYTSKDSCMSLYHDPIVWNENQQLLGEIIRVYMKDSVIDHAHVINQAFSAEELHEKECFNQVSSKEMFAFFTKGEIRVAKAKDNVLVVYYPVDDSDSSFVGLVSMQTSELRMFLADRQLERIWAPKSDGTMYPMSQIPPAKRYLEGFAWFDYVRPISKQDIFNWRPKKPGTELKEQKRREPRK